MLKYDRQSDTNHHSSSEHQSPQTKKATMNSLFLCTALISSSLVAALPTTQTKASSPYTNCGCQCSSLTFRDASGVVQGNCKTVDSTGAQWCYVDSAHSSCQDLVPSKRFPHNPWSYEACATPALGSHLCPNYPAYPHPATPAEVIVHNPVAPTDVISHHPVGPTVVHEEPTLPLGPPCY